MLATYWFFGKKHFPLYILSTKSLLYPFNRSNGSLYDVQKLLDALHGALPKMSLIASDFNYLPDVKVPGERAPLVSTKVYSSIILSIYIMLKTFTINQLLLIMILT